MKTVKLLVLENILEINQEVCVAGGVTAFTNIVKKVAASEISKDGLIEWFDVHHKVRLSSKDKINSLLLV